MDIGGNNGDMAFVGLGFGREAPGKSGICAFHRGSRNGRFGFLGFPNAPHVLINYGQIFSHS